MNTQARLPSRAMSPADFAAYGLNELAYIRQQTVDNETAYAIHGADGAALAVLPSRDVAFAVIIQNDMTPVSLH